MYTVKFTYLKTYEIEESKDNERIKISGKYFLFSFSKIFKIIRYVREVL